MHPDGFSLQDLAARLSEVFETLTGSFGAVLESMPAMLAGACVTVATVAMALGIGLVMGLPMAVAQSFAPRPLRWCVGLYVWFFRGVPILVLLYLFYFGLSMQLGLDISAFAASCLVLGMTSAAYQSQIFRGAIAALPAGQMKAARALGMRPDAAICCVVLPQALRLSIPGWSNEFSILLKDSALVSVVGTLELTWTARAIGTSRAEFAALYVTAALLYFIITFLGVRLLRRLEQRWRIPGYAPA